MHSFDPLVGKLCRILLVNIWYIGIYGESGVTSIPDNYLVNKALIESVFVWSYLNKNAE